MGRRLASLVIVGAALMGGSTAAAGPLAFTSSFQYTFPAFDHSPNAIAIGDVNGDGHQDIVVAEFAGKVAIFLNNGHGGFAQPTFLAGQCPNAGDDLAGVAIGHFTTSGHADLLVACDFYLDGFVRYRGNGNGTFGAPVRIAPVQAYTGENENRQPTFEGVVLAGLVHGTVGGVPSIVWSEFSPGGSGGDYVVCMIPDSDFATLVAGDRAPTRCSVVLIADTFEQELEFPPRAVLGVLPFPSPGSPWAFTVAPSDAGLNAGSMRGVVYTSTNPPPAQAGFSSNDIEPTHAMAGSPSLLAAPDLNGDGSSELIAAAGANNDQVAVYQLSSFTDNAGTLVIPDPQLYATNPVFDAQYGAVAGDFDGDGHPDVAVLGTNPTTVDEYVEVFPGDGSGGLGAPHAFQVSDFSSDSYFASGDLDGDGRPDLVTIVGDQMTVLLDATPATLTVNTSGNGHGVVTSSPAGITCSSSCSRDFQNGTAVTLTAAAKPGSIFTGWSGGCSGTGACNVTLHADTTVTAGFTAPAPTISGIVPSHGGIHATVTVTGTNFTGATAVQLNGQSAPYTVASPTTITFTVPTGASNGPVRVVTPGGSATSAGTFTVDPPPAITGFLPTSGPLGTVVIVTGSNLAGTVGVQLGGVLTVPTSATSGQVVFRVPPGAATGPIKLLTLAGAATSVGVFTVTP